MDTSIGYEVENWVCNGMPTEPLTEEQREAVMDYADWFEECDYSREDLASLPDHRLIEVCYAAMADYARGQM
jgi:hypothetical protein